MAYFPFFVDVTGKKCVVVGGGRIALHKIQKLLPFAPELVVIAPEILPEITDYESSGIRLKCICRSAYPEDLEGAAFVISATDEEETNAWVSNWCRSRGIPVNAVDDKEKCSFLFPALVKRGNLTIGISTEGASPQIASRLRKQIEQEIPERMEEILDYLAWLRPIAKERIKDGKRRASFLKETAQQCLEENRIFSEAETYEKIRYFQ